MNAQWIDTFWTAVGRVREPDADGALERLLDEGAGSFSDVEVRPVDFATYLAERVPPERGIAAHLASIRASDAYLACACTNLDPSAITRFEQEHQGAISLVGAKLGLSSSDRDELAQRLRSWLFVAEAGRSPGIAGYGGRGSLAGWLRVVAARAAQKMLHERRREVPILEDGPDAVVPGDVSPERAHSKRRYQTAIVDALRAALQELSVPERKLLHRRYADGTTATAIAAAEGVHRTTITRRLDELQERVMRRARHHLTEALQIDPRDCDEVLEWVATRFDVTLSRIFETSSDRLEA